MGIAFNDIPSTLRVPWAYIEFDNSGAVKGTPAMPYKVLVLGQKLAAGTAANNTIQRVTSPEQARDLFGRGSMLHQMAMTYFKNNNFTETHFVGIPDSGSGVAATGKISFAITTAEVGIIYLYIGGKRLTIGVTASMAAAALATAVAAAINADADLPVTAAVNGTHDYEVDITCRWKGATGNKIDIRTNYNSGENTPGGVTATITAMASGAGNPDIADALAAMGNEQYIVIANPYNDTANLTALTDELILRWGPLVQKEGFAFGAENDTLANLATFGNSKNTQFLSTIGIKGSPTATYQIAAAVAAVVAYYAAIDPARPFQTLQLKGVLPPADADRFTLAENNSLLYDGISTAMIDSGGSVMIQRLISMYQTNGMGADDPSYLDMCTLLTLAKLRYDFRNMILRKFPRHKLADDGLRFAPGQAILTPKMAKAEAVALARQWESDGLVENVEAFKEAMVVERNASDPNRLDFELNPDVVNQFMVAGVKMSFLV